MGVPSVSYKEANYIKRVVSWGALKVHINMYSLGIKSGRTMNEYICLTQGTRLQCKIVRMRRILGSPFDPPWPECVRQLVDRKNSVLSKSQNFCFGNSP